MLTDKRKYCIVAPLSALSIRTRLYKLANFLHYQKQCEISHVGWERVENESVEVNLDFSIKKRIILRGGGYGGSKIKLYYILWMLKVFLYSFKIKKSDIIWALGFESAFPLLLMSKLKGYKIIFDDADRFSMLFAFPRPIKKLLQYLEEFTSKNVYIHIVPGKERYDFYSPKIHELKNMPSRRVINKAKENYNDSDYIKNKLVINVNGWLGEGRGMHVILQIAKVLKEDVSIILVGKIDCEAALELSKMENVQYLGEVSNDKALETYLASDFVFTYYDPQHEINKYAESNKWGDAIKLGVGIIVNEEVLTANYLNKANVTISVPYDDVLQLTDRLSDIVNNNKKREYKSNIQSLSNKYGDFEEQLSKII
ncbi:hypothetical protein MUU74_09380 [Chryseobacterium daecheongense]|uniref:hypothetical protein n=1 Tax=Chryseobacterium daecheongense TaxID=192389 RepID=UPI001FD6562D|nr:hypothetical protein [Chryseobacterium daecheongense]UOU96709.1 hypothetical protein MUU74_09380 [Chryseobacterium daecheongense]